MAGTNSKVCDKCGWYDGYTHHRECNPARGATARDLAKTLATNVDLTSTTLGYGFGRQAIYLTDERSAHNPMVCTLVLKVTTHEEGFDIDGLHSLGQFSAEAIVDLAKILKAWRKRHKPIDEPKEDV